MLDFPSTEALYTLALSILVRWRVIFRLYTPEMDCAHAMESYIQSDKWASIVIALHAEL